MIKIGNKTPINIKKGANDINKIYSGDKLIWTKGLVLDIDFQNNFIDKTGFNTILIGDKPPIFKSDGGTGYCAEFDKTKFIKTVNPILPNNTDQVTFVFDIKTTQNETAVIFELGNDVIENQGFQTIMDPGRYISQVTALNYPVRVNKVSSTISLSNEFTNIVAITNRQTTPESKIYINKELKSHQLRPEDTYGVFQPAPLSIGQRADGTYGFSGQIKNLRVFNYALTNEEIQNL